MKLHSPKSRNEGNTLMLTVLLTALVGFVLASYLSLVKTQNVSSARSQAWNATVPVMEAGLEEALSHINANGLVSLGSDGWQQSGGYHWMQRTLGDGYYLVTISNAGASCVIESRGYVEAPVQAASAGHVVFAAVGLPSTAQGYMARGVRVTAGSGSLFAKGLVAKGQIDMNGNNVETDSFDSADPSYSTGGRYDAAKRKDNGHVATNSGLTNSLSVGNADIRGKVATGPGGTISVGSNGAVGSAAWHAGGNSGVQPGWSSDDMNVDFPDVQAPFTGGGWTPGNGVVGGTTYDYVLNSGNYQMTSLSMTGNKTMIVTGDATLYITGNFSMSGNAYVKIAPSASFKLYVGGASGSIGGNGVINEAGNATNFFYYGLPGNTSLSFTGNGTFMGIIYAPSASFSMNGGGSSDEDFSGASVTKTVTMNGHFKFHYDEQLANYGSGAGFVVNSWDEMTPDEVAALDITMLGGVSY